MLTVAIGDVLSGLANAMYELPRKAVSLATVDELGVTSCSNGKLKLLGRVEDLNFVAKNLDESGMKEYAVGGMDKVESILHLTDYVKNCDPSYAIPELTDKAQRVVDYAIQYAADNGKEISFTNNPILDTVIIMGMAVGTYLGAKRFMKGSDRLFPDYSKT